MDQQNLIKIETVIFNNEEVSSVNARDLYTFMEVKTRFNDWITRRISDAQLIENTDFKTLTQNRVSGGQTKEYLLSIDAAKHIAMLEGNDKGRQARQYFIEFEKKARQFLATLPKTDDEIIAQGYILAQKRLVELKEQHTRLQIENRHNEERIQYLEIQKDVRATEAEIIAASERVKDHYGMTSFAVAQNYIYREFKFWTGINLKYRWDEAKKRPGQKSMKLCEYLTLNGLAEKYLQVVNSLLNNTHPSSKASYPEIQESYIDE